MTQKIKKHVSQGVLGGWGIYSNGVGGGVSGRLILKLLLLGLTIPHGIVEISPSLSLNILF